MNINNKHNSFWLSYLSTKIPKFVNIIQCGKVNYCSGTKGKKFKKEFSDYICVKYGIAGSSVSVALDFAIIYKVFIVFFRSINVNNKIRNLYISSNLEY